MLLKAIAQIGQIWLFNEPNYGSYVRVSDCSIENIDVRVNISLKHINLIIINLINSSTLT